MTVTGSRTGQVPSDKMAKAQPRTTAQRRARALTGKGRSGGGSRGRGRALRGDGRGGGDGRGRGLDNGGGRGGGGACYAGVSKRRVRPRCLRVTSKEASNGPAAGGGATAPPATAAEISAAVASGTSRFLVKMHPIGSFCSCNGPHQPAKMRKRVRVNTHQVVARVAPERVVVDVPGREGARLERELGVAADGLDLLGQLEDDGLVGRGRAGRGRVLVLRQGRDPGRAKGTTSARVPRRLCCRNERTRG